MNITIVGAGYVGLSTAVNFARKHNVTTLDVSKEVVDAINDKKCLLREAALKTALREEPLSIRATCDVEDAYKNCDIAIIAVPTNYDDRIGKFDTSILDSAVEAAVKHMNGLIIIKSTVPIGYTNSQIDKWSTSRILFSPEFMREGKSLHDVSNPSRIIIGSAKTQEGIKNAHLAAELFYNSAMNYPQTLITGTKEAESVKLFSNTYLAMRITFFNELDSYAEENHLNTKEIIDGVCMDPRIGKSYANPSFGYGGYCLPKDSKQLARQMGHVPGSLIRTIPEANEVRIQSVAKRIASLTDGTIGIYGLAMKSGSDNARASASVAVAYSLLDMGKHVIIYDPVLADKTQIKGAEFVNSKEELYQKSDVVIANRTPKDLDDVAFYTRDVYGEG